MAYSRNRAILESYIPLVKFLAQQFPDTEFVLHDVSQLERSIIAIENAHISGRSIGGSATDLVLRILHDETFLHEDFTPAYTSASATGKFLRSGTYFLKDDGELVGLLCLNTDMTPVHVLKKAAEDLLDSRRLSVRDEENGRSTAIEEKLTQSVNDIPVETTLEVIRAMDLHPERMSQDERMRVVGELDRRGVFLLKGAIASVARVLHISGPTMYRYVRLVRDQ